MPKTWVLQQVNSAAELINYKSKIEAALALEGVRGLSIRFPWNKADKDFSILEAGKNITQNIGKELSIRFMAGRHTPSSILDIIPTYTVNGQRVPNPVATDTSGFEGAWRAYIKKLIAWGKPAGVHLLHLSWYAQDWAELNNGAEVRAIPGYTQEKWLRSHERLIEIAAQYATLSLAVELPLSGYGPLSNGPSARLADKIIHSVGENSNRFFAQANGWGPNGEWGAPSSTIEADFDKIWDKPIKRGLQMIQPQDYDWIKVFAHAYEVKASYVEIYLPSFNMTNKNQLFAEVKKFG